MSRCQGFETFEVSQVLPFLDPMATPPFLVEDQTDEDFFDKLIDDDFDIAGSRPEPAIIESAFSSMSIGDEGAPPEDSVDVGFAAKEEDQQENGIMQLLEAPPKDTALSEGLEFVGPEENTAEVGLIAQDDEVASKGFMETTEGIVSSSKLMGKTDESKVTSMKVVQWSAFNADQQQFDSGGFGSYSDFLTEKLDGSTNNLKANDDRKSNFAGNPVTDLGTCIVSSKQQVAQFYGSIGEQATDANDNGYWENLYPGWKCDSSTGQWYQIDGYDATMNLQPGNYNEVTGNQQESLQENIPGAGDGFISDQRSEVSYFQQTAKSVLGAVAEDCVTNNISSWNQVSQGSTEYPPNMMFDPQYPEWYYDTNTQQWHTLELYDQSVQRTTNTIPEHCSHDVNASKDLVSKENTNLYNEAGQFEQSTIHGQDNQDTCRDWSMSTYAQQSTWQHEPIDGNNVTSSLNRQMRNFNGLMGHAQNYSDQQKGFDTLPPFSDHGYISGKDETGFQSFVPAESMYQYSQPKLEQSQKGHLTHSYYSNQNSIDHTQKPFQSASTSSQFSYTRNEGRSSAGRPPHALVTFGFGGRIIIMKEAGSFGTKLNNGSQDTVGGSIFILSMMEVVMDKTENSGILTGGCDYFHALCQQTYPGPLVGGNATTKDVNKWIDEKITDCKSPVTDFRKGEILRLLLSLLKISCQHYGNLRSPSGVESLPEETDHPESAITKLFASSRKAATHLSEYGSFIHCMQNLPSEGQIRTTAFEVQNLLVSGRRKEALHCAQAGQLWGLALVLAAQLGEKFYVDTVKQMAHRQFISGSPLQTLCLLIAGQPADVFSADSSTRSLLGAANASQQPAKTLANAMLDDWEENLAIITANRTKDDELVIVHLGDCLWKERGEVTAAHTCYLVAETNFESYSDSARLCLIGADHWRCPRTYASPEAIQRTELYEYSKVLGNSQSILLPFQPYKLLYAYMLAEVGKVADSLRYCHACLKLLKNSGRAPEVEMWKSLLTSLEEQLRAHQQGGYSTNLAPAKLVGKLFTSIDKSIHRMMGTPPSPLPPVPYSSVNSKESYSVVPKLANSQSTMAMSSLIPSPSVEAISEWPDDGSSKNMHNRSVSEPVFGRSPKQDPLKDSQSPDKQSKIPLVGGFGRIGSQFLQKTVGWVSRSHADHQAKLGEKNKFYYDEKLKRWVEEGAEPPAEEAALPPPPIIDNVNSAFKSQILAANGGSEMKSPIPSEHSSDLPPISSSPTQFSAHGRLGVRSRYVDTFNKGAGAPRHSFQSPSAPSIKPPAGAKFFVPMSPSTFNERISDTRGESINEAPSKGEASASIAEEASFSSPPSTMQRYPSMDNIACPVNKGQETLQTGNVSLSSLSRASSWSGKYGDMLNSKASEAVDISGDDLHEVEL